MKTTKLILVFVIFSALFIIAHSCMPHFLFDPFNINVAKQSADATVQIIVSRILGGILTFVGVLSFVVFVYSGLLWMIGEQHQTVRQYRKQKDDDVGDHWALSHSRFDSP